MKLRGHNMLDKSLKRIYPAVRYRTIVLVNVLKMKISGMG